MAESLSIKYRSKIDVVQSKLNALETKDGYRAFQSNAQIALSKFEATQTYYDAKASASEDYNLDIATKRANYELGQISVEASFAQTQTVMTGAVKAAATAAAGEYLSVMSEYYKEALSLESKYFTATGTDKPRSTASASYTIITTAPKASATTTEASTTSAPSSSTSAPSSATSAANGSAPTQISAASLKTVGGVFAGLLSIVAAVIVI